MSYYYCGAIYVNLKHTNIAYMTRGGGGSRASVRSTTHKYTYQLYTISSYIVFSNLSGGRRLQDARAVLGWRVVGWWAGGCFARVRPTCTHVSATPLLAQEERTREARQKPREP